jgi:hypothetical protein
MTKQIIALLGVVVFSLFAVGCASTATFHRIKVVDVSTKQPITGANVAVVWPDARQESLTDGQGVASFGGYLVFGPRAQAIEVAMQGYEPLSLRLTGAIPHKVEITPIQSHK